MKTLPFSIIGGETTSGGNGMGAKRLGVKNRGETTRGETSWGRNVLLQQGLASVVGNRKVDCLKLCC